MAQSKVNKELIRRSVKYLVDFTKGNIRDRDSAKFSRLFFYKFD